MTLHFAASFDFVFPAYAKDKPDAPEKRLVV